MSTAEASRAAQEIRESERRGRIVNMAELVILFGVSRGTADGWMKAGCPMVYRGSKGKPSRLDTAQVAWWLVERERDKLEDEFKRIYAGMDPNSESLDALKRRKMSAEAESAELELMRKKGLMVAIDAVTAVVDRLITNSKNRLESIPVKAAPVIATMNNVNEICDTLREFIAEATTELSQYGPDDFVSEDVFDIFENMDVSDDNDNPNEENA